MKTAAAVAYPPRLTSIAVAAAMLAMGACALPAFAQQGASAQASPEEGLQTVVVTAQKRVQPLQKVPVAVNMVDAKAIENKQIVDFTDLTRVAPSMTVNQGNGTNTVALRGIGTFAFSIGLESAVSVIIDDVPVVQQLQAMSNLSDIERVEVLRGPQGTLFGKNSSAGVINVVTKESTDYFSGRVQLTATNDHERRAELSLSGPVSDALAFRLNGYTDSRRGDITNLTTGQDINGDLSRGLRGRLDFHPSTALSMKVIADYATRRVDGPAMTLRDVPAGARLFGAVALAPGLVGITPGPENRQVRLDNPGFTDSKNGSLSGTVSWKGNNTTLTSVSSYQDWKYDYAQDFDGTELNLLGAVTAGAANGGVNMGGPYHSRQFTQELRLASNGDGSFNYLGGLFYSNTTNDRSFSRGPSFTLAKWSATGGNQTIAAFTQLDYQLTEATRISGGLRANKESIDVRFTNLLPVVPATYAGDTSDNAVTAKLSLQHDLAKQVMVYGSVATGYKGAGFDISSGFNQSRVDHPVAPESSKAYEAGIKSRFFDNRVQVNATVFMTDYNDFQAQAAVIDPVTGVATLSVHNVGQLRTSGLELELTAKPVKSVLLEASVGYVDAIIKKFPLGTCYPGQTLALGCVPLGNATVQDLAGKTLANAPKVKYNVGATYDFALPNTGWGALVNLNYQYQSKVNFDLFQNPRDAQDAYGILNGSFAVQDDGKKYKITFFANNLTNKSYATAIADGFGSFGGTHVMTQVLPRNSQRYFGLRLKYDF